MHVTSVLRAAIRDFLLPVATIAIFCLILLLTTAQTATGQSGNSEENLVSLASSDNAAAVFRRLTRGADPNIAAADGTTPLHWAARLNNLKIAEYLIEAGANTSSSNAFGATPLHLACLNGSAAMIEFLLKGGADPNESVGAGETALMTAARTGTTEAINSLLLAGADPNALHSTGQTALMWAAGENHVEAMKMLLDAGADVNVRTPVPETQGRGSARTPRGFTAFLFAVRAGYIPAVDVLLDAGADIHDQLPDGTGPLVLAATNSHWQMGIHLVNRGADPNQADVGWSALHAMTWVRRPNLGFNPPRAVRTGNMDSLTFAKELVARGADINARMTAEPRNGYRNALNRIGATPLMMAGRLADVDLMRAFVTLGADPKLTNEDGTTVLMVSSGVGIHSPGEDPGSEADAFACVEFALEIGGGDPNAVDANGDTALHGAAYRGANSIVNALVDHGADTFDVMNSAGWTPHIIAKGIFRTQTYKEAPHTAALLEELMAARAQQ